MDQGANSMWIANIQDIFQRIPSAFLRLFSAWEDDGKEDLSDVAVVIADHYMVESDNRSTDEIAALFGLLAFFKTESASQNYHRIMVVAGQPASELVDALVSRGCLLLADIRKQPQDIGYDLFYPVSEMCWEEDTFMRGESLVWSRIPRPEQFEVMAQESLKTDAERAYTYLMSDLANVLFPMTSTAQHRRIVDTYNHLVIADEDIDRVWQELSFGTLGDVERATLGKARASMDRTTFDYYLVRIQGWKRNDIRDRIADSETTRLREKLKDISACWRYAFDQIKDNEDVRGILDNFKPQATLDETIAMLKEIGYLMGVDVMVKNVCGEDHVPIEHVVDVEYRTHWQPEQYE